ncbi:MULTISPECIES: ABC transporter ATP-binding protein [Hyphomonas]|jgi:putative ABC transport system ATP-binding protein|uniref:ABC transporter n=1 Tax=Hyphomonas chukchiensis TaxID=1280947 RepID=A0A062UE38_9PROT|nr:MULTISPECIES: ABC transporter ATP-binding protein [Hyphomonas]KCZ55978.1 ABC transporter [Hyphomonas chukchiensis]MAN89334.1 ABC transporter ATP-binding protein [Hyphomonadaceae bacterium]MBG53879.1 ABC transporter ATP-binding protein [Rhodobiaceae bacterium]HAQ76239.1 ABC transporter ATP-binding protein [Hyphomonas sp.]|tara:strand:+ start:4090 stop:4770 length:681 start_codon:yes stop_codon:yes gene_type:complete
MTAVIECKDVKRTYVSGKIEVQALQGVSLNVSAGEFVSLSGPSGCGKTTLLNIIGGLDRPNGGDVRVEDQWLNELSNSQLADLRMNRIGFVFQAYNLIPVLSAAENVGFIMQLQGKSTGERRRRAKQVLDSVGLSGMENRRPAELSGGQQQRVAVARAIASSPAIVLADEPTANLDSKASDALLQLLRQLNEEEGVTIVIASHDPKALEYARRHVRLVDGQIHSDA